MQPSVRRDAPLAHCLTCHGRVPTPADDGKDKNLSKRKALPKPRAKGGNNQAFAVGGGQDLSDDENEAPKTSDKVGAWLQAWTCGSCPAVAAGRPAFAPV